ncbi:fused MFS/spermidine synthase [Permianibacter sp. IMCC34836]|uniref:fused MFS/spermidine synthase n=1 Tax=Permianibacter fluminis TaxID=2738515 RepID=UPI001552A14E|nr:fused MFS/spermidine synthase [Permianibacter fluminis]NQD38181.1 fused MFS/spermidine synthase [Permianibacter fluminis]
MNVVVFGSAFVSGFIIMVLEMLGGRIIAPWFGGDIYVWGSIITVFMLALSLGYLLGGRWSLRNASLKRYGGIFLLGGVLMLPVVFSADLIMAAIFDQIVDARYGSLVASLALFLLPSLVMGMVSPYSVRLLTRSRETSGASAGLLYFVSTLGSALGTLATSFYLVALLEMNQILLTAIAIMIGNGMLLLALHKRMPVT